LDSQFSENQGHKRENQKLEAEMFELKIKNDEWRGENKGLAKSNMEFDK